MTNSVAMYEIEIFFSDTVLTWRELGILCESSVSCSSYDEFLLSKILKYIWSPPGFSVITQNESSPAGVFLFETIIIYDFW